MPPSPPVAALVYTARGAGPGRLKELTVGKECKLGNGELRGGGEGVGELVSLLRMWERGRFEEQGKTKTTQLINFRQASTHPGPVCFQQ